MSHYMLKEIRHLMGKAIHIQNMTKQGDRIMVSVSGGKDSMSLLWLLRERLKWLPIKYRIIAVHVDPGFGTGSADRLRSFFEEQGFEYRIIFGDFGPRAHSDENRENPCFFCSRLRRKAVFEAAAEFDCNKIALGHHKDDMIETFFLNILFSANISTMMPVQDFFNGKLTIIRPLYMTDENTLRRFAEHMKLPIIKSCCPSNGNTKREEIKKMLKTFYRGNKKIKGNIFHAMQNIKTDYMP